LIVALSSCGSHSTKSTSPGEHFVSPTAHALSPRPSSTASAPTAIVPEEQKTADQIMADALSAMEQATSVHVSGSSTDDKGTAAVELDKTRDAARQTLMDSTPGTETLVVVGGKAYDARSGPFKELPADVSAQLQSLTLSKMVACLRVEHGRLTKGAVTVVNHRRTIAIADDGKAPGAASATVFVALEAPVEVVRITVDGPVTPGGSAECGHPLDANVQRSAFDLDFSRPVEPITTPAVG
jgi:hypothetical protein